MDESGKSFSVFLLSLETQVNSIMKLMKFYISGRWVENSRFGQ